MRLRSLQPKEAPPGQRTCRGRRAPARPRPRSAQPLIRHPDATGSTTAVPPRSSSTTAPSPLDGPGPTRGGRATAQSFLTSRVATLQVLRKSTEGLTHERHDTDHFRPDLGRLPHSRRRFECLGVGNRTGTGSAGRGPDRGLCRSGPVGDRLSFRDHRGREPCRSRPSGRRPQSVYCFAVSFITLATSIIGSAVVASGVVRLVGIPSGSITNSVVRTIVVGGLVTVISLVLLITHLRRALVLARAEDAVPSPSQRIGQSYVSAVAFVSVLSLLVISVVATYLTSHGPVLASSVPSGVGDPRRASWSLRSIWESSPVWSSVPTATSYRPDCICFTDVATRVRHNRLRRGQRARRGRLLCNARPTAPECSVCRRPVRPL